MFPPHKECGVGGQFFPSDRLNGKGGSKEIATAHPTVPKNNEGLLFSLRKKKEKNNEKEKRQAFSIGQEYRNLISVPNSEAARKVKKKPNCIPVNCWQGIYKGRREDNACRSVLISEKGIDRGSLVKKARQDGK